MAESMFHEGTVHSNRVIYTPSMFARSSLLHLQEVGELQATKPHTNHRAGLSSYLFFVVRKGSGILSLDQAAYSLKSGDCVFLDCMHKYSHTPSPDDLWNLQWIHFTGPSMPDIYAKYVGRGGLPVFSPADASPYTTLLNETLLLAASDDYIRDMKINEKIASLLTLIMSESWHPDNSSGTSLKKQSLHAIKGYLDEHYQEHITLDRLSEIFYINKYYMTRVFKAQYGTTILGYLDHVRVSRAKQLLRFSDLTAEEIGAAVGIDEPGYFNRVFKKVEGVAPGEYRKLW